MQLCHNHTEPDHPYKELVVVVCMDLGRMLVDQEGNRSEAVRIRKGKSMEE